MKGIELARRYFLRYGTPLLEDRFPRYSGRIAAGLVGDGSECLGYDDELSRDHDWGPGFCLWLTRADLSEIGAPLRAAFDALPASFEGYRRQASYWGGGRIGVMETSEFYRRLLGRPAGPASLLEWLKTPESAFAAATSGEVFRDPLGEFSAVRDRLLAHYPNDVRLAKIAARCVWAGQAGQYNYPRCVTRGEVFAAQYAETKFAAEAMTMVYLLQGRYAPYFKWLHRGVAELGSLGRHVHALVTELSLAESAGRKTEIIAVICAALISALRERGISDRGSELLVEHGLAVHGRIADADLRRLDVWAA